MAWWNQWDLDCGAHWVILSQTLSLNLSEQPVVVLLKTSYTCLGASYHQTFGSPPSPEL